MLAKIARTIDRYRMFEGATHVHVAVSGGADSVCLLHCLRELAPRYGVNLSVLHVNHGLRGEESRADEAFVRELAAGFGLPFHSRSLDLAAAGGNLEQAARRARLAFFAEFLQGGPGQRVATGHTLSDQAETVLFRLLRGAGGAGLSGIRPVTSEGLVRPLLAIERAEVLAFLRARDLPWREDASNQSPEFARNRIRHGLLPQLAGEWNPAIAAALAHTADWAYEEERWRGEEVERLATAHFVREAGAVLLPAAVLAELPRAAARRLVRRAIEEVKGDTRAVRFAHIESVLALAEEPGGGTAPLPGLAVCRSFDWVRVARPSRGAPWRVPASAPGVVAVPGTGLSISLEIVDNSETSGKSHYVYNSEMGCLDWKQVSSSPYWRNWQAGDRYQPMGSSGEARLKNLFQQARVPVWERANWPVLEADGRIAWSRRFGAAAWCAAGPETPVILRVREAGR